MRKQTIQVRFFAWLSILSLTVFLLIGLTLFFYDSYEYIRDPAMVEEEVEEIIVMATVMAVLFPISLLGAWLISRILLRPWKALVLQAERISAGRLEERIEMANPSDEIGRLAYTLNQTFDRYQRLLDRLHRFSYDASHQLRNPLAAIRTAGGVCLKHPRTVEEYQSVIGEILEDVTRLSHTVDQLLMLARASGEAIEEGRTRVSLQPIAAEVVREGRAIGEMRGLAVELVAPEGELMMLGIPDLLREALANLVDNALKFTPDGGQVQVVLTGTVNDRVRIEVSDSGSGIPPHQKATVFRPFVRSGQNREGTGLGLAIVADICRAHGGCFGVENPPEGGSLFWMEFPPMERP